MLAAGTTLGLYKIVGPLGAGGLGEVHRAHDSCLRCDAAIKVPPRHLAATSQVRPGSKADHGPRVRFT